VGGGGGQGSEKQGRSGCRASISHGFNPGKMCAHVMCPNVRPVVCVCLTNEARPCVGGCGVGVCVGGGGGQ